MIKDIKVEAIHPDPTIWAKMGNVYRSCKAANIPIPAEVLDYFGSNSIYIKRSTEIIWTGSIYKTGAGISIDVTKLPAGTKFLEIEVNC